MRKLIYFTADVWERIENESKKLSLSRSAYIRMVLLEHWEITSQ